MKAPGAHARVRDHDRAQEAHFFRCRTILLGQCCEPRDRRIGKARTKGTNRKLRNPVKIKSESMCWTAASVH